MPVNMKARLSALRQHPLLANKKVRFVAAGVLNTGIDFTIFNLAIFAFGFKTWLANLCSTTIAMVISYFVNKVLVFDDRQAMNHRQFLAFIAVTVVGLWGLQTVIVVGLSKALRPAAAAILGGSATTVHWLTSNVAKAVGTVASAVWNYLWYDRTIFVHSKVKPQEWL